MRRRQIGPTKIVQGFQNRTYTTYNKRRGSSQWHMQPNDTDKVVRQCLYIRQYEFLAWGSLQRSRRECGSKVLKIDLGACLMREFFCWIKGRKEHTVRTLRSGQAICRPRHPRFSVLSNQSQSSSAIIIRSPKIHFPRRNRFHEETAGSL